MKFTGAFFALPLLAGLALAGCSDREEHANTVASPAEAVPQISNARLVLSPVSGNPAAAYYDITNPSEEQLTLTGVEIAGVGRSEIHQSMEMDGRMTMEGITGIDIEAGGTSTLAPGGMHVMAFDLDNSLEAGSAARMTLTFADGDKVTASLPVQAAGDDR